MAHVQKLAYLGLEVRDLSNWEHFATHNLGLVVDQRLSCGTLTLRMDQQATRFMLREGPANDLFAVGWQVADSEALTEIQARLHQRAISSTPLSAAQLELRKVQAGIAFLDPSGVPTELAWGPKTHAVPFASPQVPAGFITGKQGLGHLVLRCQDKTRSVDFYTQMLGFRMSDRIICTTFGLPIDIDFFHTQGGPGVRHHSLALSEPIPGVPAPQHVFHFMIEAAHQDAVGKAYDRAIATGTPLAQTLGRHPNDQMFSFYARSPSGFQVEFGWGGKTVDDTDWQTSTYDRLSIWGHHPPALLAPRRKKEGS